MQDYDVVLKAFCKNSFQRLTSNTVVLWLPTELPKVQNLLIDRQGETID